MNFRQEIAKYVSGNLTTERLPEIGVKGLEEGLDTPSLRILAGLAKNENLFQIEQYFKLTIEELKFELPSKRQAAIEYSLAVVDEILDGEKDIIKGLNEIHDNAIESFDFLSETREYCYDSIGYDVIYGLFDTYKDLANANLPWQIGKTNEQLITEIKDKLLIELKKWKENIENGL